VLGRIPQPALVLQLTLAKDELTEIREEEQVFIAAQKQERAMQAQHTQLETAFEESRIASNQAQLAQRSNVQKNDPPVTRERQIAAQSAIDEARGRLLQLTIQTQQQDALVKERLRTIRAKLKQAEGKCRALQKQLEFQSSIISEVDGQVVEMMAVQGDIVKAGQPLLSVEKKERQLEAVIFLPPHSNAKNIVLGMEAQVTPVNTKKERDGYLLGKVISVAQYPATEQGMMAILHNADLVHALSRDGPPFAVVVGLQPDPHHAGDYQWSSNAGAANKVSSGTLATASFIVDRQRPISFLLPWFKSGSGLSW
jgi:HlyD family secretion protein